MQKIPKNSKILKNDGHFRIPHHKISLKQFSNICENEVYFFYYVGGWKNDSFSDILQLPHTVISNSEKLTHPTVHRRTTGNPFNSHEYNC